MTPHAPVAPRPAGRARARLWPALAVLLALVVAFGVGSELGARPDREPAPAEPVISVEYEATGPDGRHERVSVTAPEPVARELFDAVVRHGGPPSR